MSIIKLLKIMLRARPIKSPERLFFEQVIIPAFGMYGVKRVLFVGVAPYTWHYGRLFRRQDIELWTIDVRPDAAVWGARNRHIVGDISNSGKVLSGGGFDLVIMMGIIGYGLNDVRQVRCALEQTSALLSPLGRILIACEDKFNLDPVAIAKTIPGGVVAVDSFCFPASVRLPGCDYGLHYFSRT